MFTVEERGDGLETLVLRDTTANDTLVLAPSRGGLATRLVLAGRDTFYLDEGTLHDTTKNVRGGNPVLFPQPGKLEDDRYEWGGVIYPLKQHGFARNEPWKVTRTSTRDRAEATLTLVSNERTRAVYPWDFHADYTYWVEGNRFGVDMRIACTSAGGEAMPFGAGFHPYFLVPQATKAKLSLGTPARFAFDNVAKVRVPVSLDLERDEVDLHLEDHGEGPFTLSGPDGTLTLTASPPMNLWVIWTVRGKDYVCVEPWTSPGNALRTRTRLLTLEPGTSTSLSFIVERT